MNYVILVGFIFSVMKTVLIRLSYLQRIALIDTDRENEK